MIMEKIKVEFAGEGTEQTRLEIEVQKLNNENNTLKQCFLSIFEENEKLKKYFSMLFEELEQLTDKSGCDVCFEWEHKDEVLKLIKGE